MSVEKKKIRGDGNLPYTFTASGGSKKRKKQSKEESSASFKSTPGSQSNTSSGTATTSRQAGLNSFTFDDEIRSTSYGVVTETENMVDDSLPGDLSWESEENAKAETTEDLVFSTPVLEIDVYKELVIAHHAITPVNSFNTAFIVPGLKKNRLSSEVFVVERRSVHVGEGRRWLYFCSCNPYRTRCIRKLQSTIENEQDIDFQHPEHKACIHVNGLEQILQTCSEIDVVTETIDDTECFSDHAYHKDDPGCTVSEVYVADWNRSMFCLHMKESEKDSYTLLSVDFKSDTGKLFCQSYTCRENKFQCRHVDFVKAQMLLDENIFDVIRTAYRNEPKIVGVYVPVTVSKERIPFISMKNDCAHQGSQFLPEDDGVCDQCGHKWADECQFRYESDYFTFNETKSVEVYYRPCSNLSCNNAKEFDGGSEHILHMSTYLISHELLRDYMRQFSIQGTTMAAFYKQWAWMQIENGQEFSTKMTYFKFQQAWYAFLKLIDVETSSCFLCPTCGPQPELVIMDGLSLSLRKMYIPWDKLQQKNEKQLDGSHNTRVYINNKEAREMVYLYASKGLDQKQFHKMKDLIKIYQPGLLPILLELEEGGFFQHSPKQLDRLFTCLSKNYSITALIHPSNEIFKIIRKMENQQLEAKDIVFLEVECPFLSYVVSIWTDSIKDIVKSLDNLIQRIYPADLKQHDLKPCSCTSCNCGKEEVTYLPKLPQKCHRGDYIRDNQNQKDPVVSVCRKKRPGHPVLAPGLFTLSCQHGICYGYQMLDKPESVNVPFTLLRTRFDTAPKYVIYDNCCNLHNYCMNRDPVFFKNTRFLVDRLHWKNHTACHEGYNMSLYPNMRKINSQVAEQRNSTLQKLKSMLSYMNLDKFKCHLNFFLWYHNRLSWARNSFATNDIHNNFFESYYKTVSKFTS